MLCFASGLGASRVRAALRAAACTTRCQRRRRTICSAAPAAASTSAMTRRKTAAALIIGDEILSGKTLDTNTQTLGKHLVQMGVSLRKTETIGDEIGVISDAVKRLALHHDLVFTSGGIGPTLDDVTYEGVARAFALRLVRHEQTVLRMRQIQPHMVLNEARLRMVMLPEHCDVIWSEGLWVPIAVVRNVYILPGVPKLFTQMMNAIPRDVFGHMRARQRKIVWCDMAEGDLAATLAQTVQLYDVKIGSYPATTERSRKLYRTMISVEGEVASIVEEASNVLIRELNGRYGYV
eukprot:TRINITY_DN180_c0_g2_i1.p1 TRINITY_DN180_c0_g2~~TRINITY_DN180_c0_g2_i1.p1  ORF type:complete len:293 (+),score=56.74 TRINITY_DN180_c0_g2_i1:3649-4527(+)